MDYFPPQYQILLEWLQNLPKPTGLLCLFLGLAHRLLHFIVEHGMNVPDDLAVLSAERDDSRMYMCVPPLSMVDLGEFRLGYEAAGLLHRKMTGRDSKTHRIVIPPAGLIARGSTDILAVDSPRLAEAIRFIRRHALRGLQIGDIVEHCSISKRGLEVAMRRNFGRTVQEELTRIRVAEAKRLLSSTSLAIAEIGPRCGFEWGTTLHAVFKREVGQTPGQYRNHCRGRPEPGP